MRKIFNFIPILILGSTLYAQNVLNTGDQYPELKFTDLTGTIYYRTNRQVLGSAFLDDNYRNGRIFLQNGTSINNVKLKLDLFANDLIAYQDIKQLLVIVDKDAVNGFEFDGVKGTEKYIRVQGIKSKSFGKYGSYVRVLTEGTYSFYKLQYKEQVAIQNPTGLYLTQFHDKTEYHLFLGYNDEKVKLSRHTLKKFFPAHKSEIRKFIHESKIKPGTEEGFAKSIEFINTLQ
jgi:hypothetical protein